MEALNLRPFDQLVYEIEPDGRVTLSAKTGSFASVAASLSPKSRRGGPWPVDEMEAAVKSTARRRFERTKP
jgi:hypothetical protein